MFRTISKSGKWKIFANGSCSRLLILIIYRIGSFIPVPNINQET